MQVITHPKGERWERRTYTRGPVGSDGYTHTIRILDSMIADHLRAHDAKLEQKYPQEIVMIDEDEKAYAPNYSLANHNGQVGRIAARITAAEPGKFSSRDVAIIRTAGRWHDVGKTLRRNWFYRESRGLTEEEFARKTAHAPEGERILRWYITRYFQTADARVKSFIEDVLTLVANHHEMRPLSDSRVFALTVRLSCVDKYWSIQEDRPDHRGRGEKVALKILRRSINQDLEFRAIKPEALHVAALLESIYVPIPTQQEVDEEIDSKSR